MKKIISVILAVLMVAVLALSAGCDKGNAAAFNSGTWASKTGTNFVFYEDGKSGKTVNVADGEGIGFEYDVKKNGSCVFHMGSADDKTKATVEFLEGGDDTAAITWEDGSRIVLYFVSEDTSDEFADNFVFGQVTGNDVTGFKAGKWESDNGDIYEFYADDTTTGNITYSDGMGIAFAYELAEDGTCVFHMGGVEDITNATVAFTDADNAVITWESGSTANLKFVGGSAAATDPEALVGTWHDAVAGRASMTVTMNDGNPYVEVIWPDSAAAYYVYNFLCEDVNDEGKLVYTSGFKGIVEADEEGNETKKILDESADGTVELSANGSIIWTEDAAKDDPHEFVKD